MFAFVLLMITREGWKPRWCYPRWRWRKVRGTAHRCRARCRWRGSDCLAVGALRPPCQSGALLPGHGDLSADLLATTGDLRRARLSEANALPGIDNEWLHLVSEPYGPEGYWGQMLTWSMVAVPLAFLLWVGLLARIAPAAATASARQS